MSWAFKTLFIFSFEFQYLLISFHSFMLHTSFFSVMACVAAIRMRKLARFEKMEDELKKVLKISFTLKPKNVLRLSFQLNLKNGFSFLYTNFCVACSHDCNTGLAKRCTSCYCINVYISQRNLGGRSKLIFSVCNHFLFCTLDLYGQSFISCCFWLNNFFKNLFSFRMLNSLGITYS